MKKYQAELSDVKGVRIYGGGNDATKNYAYFPILVEDGCQGGRDGLYQRLQEHGVYSRKYFYPLTSDQACFKNKYRSARLDAARRMSDHVLVLPLYEELSDEDVERICRVIKE